MADEKKIVTPKEAAVAVLKKFEELLIKAEKDGKPSLIKKFVDPKAVKSGKKVEDDSEEDPEKDPEVDSAAPAPAPVAAPAAAVAVPPVAPAAPPAAAVAAPKPESSGNSPTRTNTETGGSSPGGASTGGVGSGIGGAGTGGAATGGASTGGAGTVNLTISGNSGTGSNGEGKPAPITINISNIGGKTDAGNVASGDGPGAKGDGGSGKGSGGGGGGASPDEPENFSTSNKDDKDDKDDKKKPSAKDKSMKKSEEIKKDEVAPPADGGQTINSQIGSPFGKAEKPMKGHIKLAKFLGHMEGKRSVKVDPNSGMADRPAPDSGNDDPTKPVNQGPNAMGMQKADVLANKPGQVSAGGNIRSAHRSFEHAKNPNASSPKIEREMGKESSAKAKEQHKEKLKVIQNQPKPKLPR